MRKIKWYELVLISCGIVSGWLFKNLLTKYQMNDWWFVPFIVAICLAYIWIDIKPRSDSKEEG